jgi:hypothetical protein
MVTNMASIGSLQNKMSSTKKINLLKNLENTIHDTVAQLEGAWKEEESARMQELMHFFCDDLEKELTRCYYGHEGIQQIVTLTKAIASGKSIDLHLKPIAMTPKEKPDSRMGSLRTQQQSISTDTSSSSRTMTCKDSSSALSSHVRSDISHLLGTQELRHVHVIHDMDSSSPVTTEKRPSPNDKPEEGSSSHVKKIKKEPGFTMEEKQRLQVELEQKKLMYPAETIWPWHEEISWIDPKDEEIKEALEAHWSPEIFQLINFWHPVSTQEGRRRSHRKSDIVNKRNLVIKKMILKWGFKKTLALLTPERTNGQFWFGYEVTRLDKMTEKERKNHLMEYRYQVPRSSRENHASNLLQLIENMNGSTQQDKTLSAEVIQIIQQEEKQHVVCEDPVLENLWRQHRQFDPWRSILQATGSSIVVMSANV